MKQKTLNSLVMREERQADGNYYVYELMVREGARTADFGLSLYSIRISMTDKSGLCSQREATDVFTNPERAIEFFNKLVNNLATPIDLVYVIEDEIWS